jgi:general secretion pathway protein G
MQGRVWSWWPEAIAALGLVPLLVLAKPFERRSGRSTVQRIRADMKALGDAITLYRIETGAAPARIEDLWVRPKGLARWGPEPYLKDWPVLDPWGGPYLYRPSGSGRFELVSLGADLVPGGQDEAMDLSSRTINDW